MIQQAHPACTDARVLVLGLTFKENCPDLRNTQGRRRRARAARSIGAQVDVYDPWADARRGASTSTACEPVSASRKPGTYDAVIVLAVAHDEFRELGIRRHPRARQAEHVLYDIKHVFQRDQVDGRL